jgi:hypothetical protein
VVRLWRKVPVPRQISQENKTAAFSGPLFYVIINSIKNKSFSADENKKEK